MGPVFLPEARVIVLKEAKGLQCCTLTLWIVQYLIPEIGYDCIICTAWAVPLVSFVSVVD